MSDRAHGTALLWALIFSAGCASASPSIPASEPAVRARLAVMALAREDFDRARPRLLELASQCQTGEHGRRAVLLLAAAELDTENESGSPTTALQLARSYLLLPNAPRDEVVLARALYRVAAELGGLEEASTENAPVIAPRFDGCDATPELGFRPMPSTTNETVADRIHALEATIAAQADSLARLSAQTGASRRRTAELEQQLERITQLLTSGAERQTSGARQ